MNKITFSQNDCKEETTSICLISVMQYGLELQFFKPLEYFKLKMKEVKFCVYQKLITIIMSIVIGREFMKDINEKLSTEKLSANLFNMEGFPDQSGLIAKGKSYEFISLRRKINMDIKYPQHLRENMLKQLSWYKT